jgi:sec-independent protein translocase protein TatC
MSDQPENNSKKKRDPSAMSFLEHLGELRDRLISCIKCMLVVLIACGYFYQDIGDFYFGFIPERVEIELEDGEKATVAKVNYEKRLEKGEKIKLIKELDRQLLSITPVETFMTMIKCLLLTSFIISVPWILFQVWLFISPGLYANEKKHALPFVLSGTFFFVAGLTFAFFIGLPTAINVLYGYDWGGLAKTQWTISSTLGFVLRLFLAFGIAFELPVVVFTLASMGIVTPKTLAKQRPYVLLGLLILSAVLTPPDWITQLLLAGPLYVLFELSILAARIFVREKKPETT